MTKLQAVEEWIHQVVETYFDFDTEYHWDIFVYCSQLIAECVESGIQYVGINKDEFTSNMMRVDRVFFNGR